MAVIAGERLVRARVLSLGTSVGKGERRWGGAHAGKAARTRWEQRYEDTCFAGPPVQAGSARPRWSPTWGFAGGPVRARSAPRGQFGRGGREPGLPGWSSCIPDEEPGGPCFFFFFFFFFFCGVTPNFSPGMLVSSAVLTFPQPVVPAFFNLGSASCTPDSYLTVRRWRGGPVVAGVSCVAIFFRDGPRRGDSNGHFRR